MFLSNTPDLNALIFALYVLILHPQIYFGFRYRTFYFTSMMITGMTLEIVHWMLRSLERQESDLVVVGPAFIGVAIHLSITNIAGLEGLPFKMHTRIAGANWAALILQVVGGAIAWSERDAIWMVVMKAGLVFQLIGIATFARLLWLIMEVEDTERDIVEYKIFCTGQRLSSGPES
jgi:hypothetical protein